MRRFWEWVKAGVLVALGLDEIEHWREVVGGLGALLVLVAAALWGEDRSTAVKVGSAGLALIALALLNWWLTRFRESGREKP